MNDLCCQGCCNDGIEFLCVAEVAKLLKRSTAWVSRHHREIGGVKIAGSILFPSAKEIYERIFQQKQGVVGVRLPTQPEKTQTIRVQDKERSSRKRSRREKDSKESSSREANRHGILDVVK